MNISQGTKNRLQIKSDTSLVYLTSDMNDLGDGDILCLGTPKEDYYNDDILYTAGEFDIKNTIIFSYKLSDQVVYNVIAEDIKVVYVNKPLDSEKDVKKLSEIPECQILVTNITKVDDLAKVTSALSPSIVCVTEEYEGGESYEKMKTFKIKSVESADDDNIKYIVLQK